MNFTKFQGVEHPLILWVPITILHRTESMGDPLNGVDNGAAEIINRVYLPFQACPMMRLRVTSVDDGVTHSFVGVVDRDLSTNAPLKAFLRTGFHFLEAGKTFLGAAVATLALKTIPALFLHCFLIRVIRIGVSLFDDLHAIFIQLLEVITRVGNFVWFDIH